MFAKTLKVLYHPDLKKLVSVAEISGGEGSVLLFPKICDYSSGLCPRLREEDESRQGGCSSRKAAGKFSVICHKLLVLLYIYV